MKKVTMIVALVLIGILGCSLLSKIDTIEVTPSTATLGVGATQQFTAVAKDADGVEVSDLTFTWSSSDAAVATVDANGLVTAVAIGTCTITAEAEGKKGTASVTVSETGGPTYHSDFIDSNQTWYASGNPHIIDSDISVQDNATLTIMPGCIVKFQAGTELYCGYYSSGAIVAEGTADSMITFTSNVPAPAPGDWKSIGVYNESMSTTSFKYCIIEYGGQNTQDGEFVISDVGTKLSNCTIRKSDSYGITLNNNGYFKTFDNNTVTECANFPLDIFVEQVRTIGSGNTFTGNTKDAILVRGGFLTTTCTWVNPGVPYQIEDDVSIGDDSNTPTLTIAPSTTIKFQSNVEFYVGYYGPGGLIADGTSGWITFTSAVEPKTKGDWQAISFYQYSIDAQCKLKNCKIEYAGFDEDGNVFIYDAIPEISGDSIGHGKGYGIYLGGDDYPDTTALRANNTFYDNDLGDVYAP